MKNKVILMVIVIAVLGAIFSGCSGSEKAIVGTWVSEDGSEVLLFEKNGTCSVPFTYDSSWWESCDRYAFVEDKLVLSSSQGNISTKRFEKIDTPEDVERWDNYYLSKDTLVIHETTYKREK